MAESVVIERRFNGPPDSGNGGYTCGLLARSIDGVAEVTLRQPPPLDVELRLEVEGARVELRHGEELVAEAQSVAADRLVEPPAPVSLDEARAAAARSRFFEAHPFPTCFVCGPERDAGDGLRIFPGPVDGRELYASAWTAPAEDGKGAVPTEVVWAALDCPTSAPLINAPGPDGTILPIVLARLAADVRAPVEPGADHVITSWEIGREGRKREAGSALYDAGGELLALARALWIELRATA